MALCTARLLLVGLQPFHSRVSLGLESEVLCEILLSKTVGSRVLLDNLWSNMVELNQDIACDDASCSFFMSQFLLFQVSKELDVKTSVSLDF